MRWLYLVQFILLAAMGFYLYREGEFIDSMGRGAYVQDPAYSSATDAQVQRACDLAHADAAQRAAGTHMDAMQVDGRDYSCK